MYLKTLSLGDIHPYERNPRINDKAVEPVMKSIQKDGYRARIIVDNDGVIIAGHTRYEAMKRLGWTEAEVWIADDMTPEQIADYRIRDNLTADFAEWDFSELEAEIQELDLDFDMSEFEGFEGTEDSWFDRREKDGTERQEGNDEYNEFLDKFETKKTTDDCYTPDNIYDAVADWVANEYKLSRSAFVRPFYPGGNYQREKYKKGCVVVDNPPFSILSEIIKWYNANGVKFFLFAPTLSLFTAVGEDVEYMPCGVDILYENGAKVCTSFINNLGENRIYVSAALYAAVDAANDENLREAHKDLPKYIYPDEAVLAARIYPLAKYGQTLRVPKSEAVYQNRLDAQKEAQKDAFGGLFLLSERMAAERAAAERAAAERAAAERAAAERAAATKWQLSAREREIVRSLGK